MLIRQYTTSLCFILILVEWIWSSQMIVMSGTVSIFWNTLYICTLYSICAWSTMLAIKIGITIQRVQNLDSTLLRYNHYGLPIILICILLPLSCPLQHKLPRITWYFFFSRFFPNRQVSTCRRWQSSKFIHLITTNLRTIILSSQQEKNSFCLKQNDLQVE